MCEYCGCQALSVIAELTGEHDDVVNLISRVRAAHAAGDVVVMADVAVQISAVLGPHTAVEEEGLFPPLADEFPDHPAALARLDTADWEAIDTVRARVGSATLASTSAQQGAHRPAFSPTGHQGRDGPVDHPCPRLPGGTDT